MSDKIIITQNWALWAKRSNYCDVIDELNFEYPIPPISEAEPKSIFYIAQKYNNDLYKNLSTRKLYPIHVLQWRDPVDIWISLEALRENVISLDKQLQKWYTSWNFESRLETFSPGTPCAFKDGNRWRRGMVNLYSEGSDTVLVRFVDKGIDRFVDVVNIRPLLNVFADVPPSAIHVRLFGVQMAELTQKLISKSNNYFYDLGRDFACRFVFTDDMYSLDQYKIELYDINRLGDYRHCYDLESTEVAITPKPDEDLVAKSGLFHLSRGSWKNYTEEEYASHRVRGRRVSFWEDAEYKSSDSDDPDTYGDPIIAVPRAQLRE